MKLVSPAFAIPPSWASRGIVGHLVHLCRACMELHWVLALWTIFSTSLHLCGLMSGWYSRGLFGGMSGGRTIFSRCQLSCAGLFQMFFRDCLWNWETSALLLCEDTLHKSGSIFVEAYSCLLLLPVLPGFELSSVSQAYSISLPAVCLCPPSPPLWPFFISSSADSSFWQGDLFLSSSWSYWGSLVWFSSSQLLHTFPLHSFRLTFQFSPTPSWLCLWASIKCCRCPSTLPFFRILANWSGHLVQVALLCLVLSPLR